MISAWDHRFMAHQIATSPLSSAFSKTTVYLVSKPGYETAQEKHTHRCVDVGITTPAADVEISITDDR